MAQPGILSWATSIRATMVNDSCRQSLEDQIQVHGFLFLDDYLDNILAQAKRGYGRFFSLCLMGVS
jgi:hypothetical protein